MPITLITGVPGHGKTLLGIDKALKFVDEGRTVYVDGIKGIDLEKTGFLKLPFNFKLWDPSDEWVDPDTGEKWPMPKWQTLPDGAVFLIDECYRHMPTRPSGAKVPPHIDALARHRHNGFDFILLTQKHNQLDSFLHGLIETHIHVRRKWGFNRAVLKTWDEFQSNTKAGGTIAAPLWKYPKRIFGMYTSATKHTFKPKLPWFYYLFAVLLPLVIYGFWHMTHATPPATPAVNQVQPGQPGGQVGDKVDDTLRRRDFVAWMTPRVPGQPWTAPAWDNLQPQGTPDLYCMAVETGECSCMTEQGTKYEVKASVCRKIARDGNYNPFRKPLDDRQRERGREPHQERQERQDGPAVAVAAPSGYWPKSTIPQDYSPPQHQIATQETYQ